MNRYFIHFCYDGTPYHGWQYQPNAVTVQETLEKALALMLRCGVALTGCGRTDSGVHARQFFAHFESGEFFSRKYLEKLTFKLNSFLDPSIAIREIFPVPENAHARFSAVSRTYEYIIARIKDPFNRPFAYYLHGPVALDKMNEGCRIMRDYIDFTSFSKVDTDSATNNCRIIEAVWTDHGDRIVFRITADRFLRNMVRAITGTMIEIGTGKLTLEEFREIIVKKDRKEAGESVPACGLFLTRVVYPADIVKTAVNSV